MKRILVIVGLSLFIATSSFAAWNELTIRKGQTETLQGVIERVKTTKNAVVVFDLDSTLFDNRPRNIRIVQEYAVEKNLPELFKLENRHFDETWGLDHQLVDAGVKKDLVSTVWPDLSKFWVSTFFTSHYAGTYDVPLPGPVQYVKAVRDAGATIVYVSGRNENMKAGSEAALKHFGFPTGKGTQMFLKPAVHKAAAKDTDYKRVIADKVKTLGTVVAAFDNEPSHVNTYAEVYTGATVVFLDTDHSPAPDKPKKELAVVNGWLMK